MLGTYVDNAFFSGICAFLNIFFTLKYSQTEMKAQSPKKMHELRFKKCCCLFQSKNMNVAD